MKLQQHLENCLLDWARISGLDFTLLDSTNQRMVRTRDVRLPSAERIAQFRESKAYCVSFANGAMYKVKGNASQYILVVSGNPETLPTIGELAVCQVSSLFQAYAEKNDRISFLQDLLAGNAAHSDLSLRAKQFRIPEEADRVVFIVEPKQAEGDEALATIRNIYSARTKDFVIPLSRTIVVVHELLATEAFKDMESIAHMLVDMLGAEAMLSARVSYSRPVHFLSELETACRQAKTALEVGKLFYAQSSVFGYERLGIGRLIYALPTEICEMFVREIYGEEDPEMIDEETLSTIRTLFENNLNLSETARQLFVHRNTLVYRFEKIQKKLGLDVRTFEDAITFKIAMMVVDALKARKT